MSDLRLVESSVSSADFDAGNSAVLFQADPAVEPLTIEISDIRLGKKRKRPLATSSVSIPLKPLTFWDEHPYSDLRSDVQIFEVGQAPPKADPPPVDLTPVSDPHFAVISPEWGEARLIECDSLPDMVTALRKEDATERDGVHVFAGGRHLPVAWAGGHGYLYTGPNDPPIPLFSVPVPVSPFDRMFDAAPDEMPEPEPDPDEVNVDSQSDQPTVIPITEEVVEPIIPTVEPPVASAPDVA